MGDRDHLVRLSRILRILQRILNICNLDSPTQLRLDQIDAGTVCVEALFESVPKISRVQDKGMVAFLYEVCADLVPSKRTAAGEKEDARCRCRLYDFPEAKISNEKPLGFIGWKAPDHMQRFLEYLDEFGRDVRQRRQAKCALDIGRQGYRARYAVDRKISINSLKSEEKRGRLTLGVFAQLLGLSMATYWNPRWKETKLVGLRRSTLELFCRDTRVVVYIN